MNASPSTRRAAAALRGFAALLAALTCATALANDCVPPGTWARPSAQGAVRVEAREVLAQASRRAVVLLGELHDREAHHRWQLHTLSGLHALSARMVIGFEMFPRRVQPVLDRWVAGELSEAEFLVASDWARVWGYETAHYLPLFHFARMHRIPMLALNVERSLVREIARKGEDAVLEHQREGVGRPAAAPSHYLAQLHAIFLEHPRGVRTDRESPEFLRFVQGQLTWDRAMAEAIHAALRRDPGVLVVGVLGRGHAVRDAVPHQLRDLGIADTMVLLPWDHGTECAQIATLGAHAVFGIEAERRTEPTRPRLGVTLAADSGAGVRIEQVVRGSIAELAGLQDGDVVVAIAGVAAASAADVQQVVARQAPGTWLPIRVRRNAGELELIAKFPVR